jgi:3-oxoacyl-[acyl-carrier-protein] synthase-3
VVTNEELVGRGIDTSDAWIRDHIGIRERRFASATEATSDLAARAANRAIEAAGVPSADIDFVICATSTPDFLLPSTAGIVQRRIGARGGALDINVGCSGFPYALALGFGLRQMGVCHLPLVVCADTYSRLTDPRERTTSVIFGDGAGAAVLGPSSGSSWLLAVELGADGTGVPHLATPTAGFRPELVAQDGRWRPALFMDGPRVKDFVQREVPGLVRRVLGRAGATPAGVAAYVFHQANLRLLSWIRDQLGLREDQVAINIERYGNMASASSAVVLDELARGGRLRPGDLVVIAAFGAGWSWGALCIQWRSGAARDVSRNRV